MSRRLSSWFFVPAWLLVMIAVAAAGLYLGYTHPEVTTALVILFFVGAWLFWSSWHDLVRH